MVSRARKHLSKMNLKRFFIILLKIIGWIAGIWISILIILQLVLSPGLTTDLVNRYAPEYIGGDIRFGKTSVSILKNFPNISLTLEDFSISYPSDTYDEKEKEGAQGWLMRAGRGELADTLASFRNFTVSLNVPALLTGAIRIPYVGLEKPRIFAHLYADGSANWDILTTGTETAEDTTAVTEDTEPSVMPNISIGEIQFTGRPRIVYTDSRDTVFAAINLRRMEFDGRIHTRRMSRNRLDLTLDTMFVSGRLKADTLALGIDRLRISEKNDEMDFHAAMKTFLATRAFGRMKVPVDIRGRLSFPKDTVPAISLRDFKAEVASIPISAQADVRLYENRTGLDGKVSIDNCQFKDIIGGFAANLIPGSEKISTDASIDLDLTFSGAYDHITGRLPDFKARLSIPESVSAHSDIAHAFTMGLEAEAGTDSRGRVTARIDTLDLRTAGLGLGLKGAMEDVLGEDPAFVVDGSLSVVLDSLKSFLPDTLDIEANGRVDAALNGRILMSQANMYGFSRSDMTGNLRSDSIVFRMPSDTIDVSLYRTDSVLGPEEKVSRRDSTRSFRLMGITGNIGGMDIRFKDAFTAIGEEVMISAKNSASSDTSRINPLSGRLKAERLGIKDSESTSLTIRNTSNSFMLMPKKGQPKTPVLSLRSSNDKIILGTSSNRAILTDASLKVSAAMNTVEKRMRREAFLDSLAKVYPDIPRDSLFAHSRAQRSSRPIPEWLKEEDFRKQDIDIRLDETMAKYFREWDLNGSASIRTGIVMTPHLPLRNLLRGFEGHFNNNEIGLDSLKVKIGDSEIEAKGKLTGLRRALLRKGTIKADLDVKSSGMKADQLLAAVQAGSRFNAERITIDEDVSDAEFLKMVTVDTTSLTEVPSLIVIPSNLNADIRIDASNVKYTDLDISQLNAGLIVKERCAQITGTEAKTNMGTITLDAFYATRTKTDLKSGFSLNFKDITAERVISLMPAVDSLMPMLKSFKGLLNCEIAATADLDTAMNIVMPTIDGVMRISGQNLTLSDNELYKTLAKKLFFKNKEEAKIKNMTVEGVIRNSTLEVFPFVLKLDRYTLAMSGIQNLDQSFKYHASLIRSPFLIKLGVDLYGKDFDGMKFKIGKAKYKNEDIPVFSTVIDRTKVNLLESIRGIFDVGVDAAMKENRNQTLVSDMVKKIGYVRAVDQEMESLSEEEQKQIEKDAAEEDAAEVKDETVTNVE